MRIMKLKSNSGESTKVWGLRVSPDWPRHWQSIALVLGVSTNRLVTHILQDWLDANKDWLRKRYLLRNMGHLEDWPCQEVHPEPESGRKPDKDDNNAIRENLDAETLLETMRVNLNIRGVTAATKFRLRGLAIARGKPVYWVVDDLVANAWEEVASRTPTGKAARRWRKVTRQIFQNIKL
jgi:hypothetical protein